MEKAPEHVIEVISKYSNEEIEEMFDEDMAFGTAGIRGPIKYGTAFINEYTIARNA
jgi:predicted lactoylglutathione lyase